MSTRERVLKSLRSAGVEGVSGEAMASQLGISRVAVGKHVNALRAAGYRIDAQPGVGYRLDDAPDLPLPSEVVPLVTDPLWIDFQGGARTGSTNDDARALANADAPEGTVVLAAAQGRGRGRLGREWVSPEGGAYVSVILRPAVPPVDAASLSLVVALAVARGLASLGAKPWVKWPNDVYLAGGKVAGVLLEMSAEADRVDWIVAGIGVNVRHCGPRGSGTAAYLADEIPGVRVAEVAAAVLNALAGNYRDWLAAGFEPMRAEYERLHMLGGRYAEVRDLTGSVTASGTVCGVNGDGCLLLEGPDGLHAVAAGEVTLRK